MKDKQAFVVIVTGFNKSNKLMDLTENMNITTLNTIKDIENS